MKQRLYLIHGLMGTGEQHFHPQLMNLKDKFDLYPIDLPGHGSNQEPAADPYFEHALEWVAQHIRIQGKGHIMGVSLGASIGIHLAIRYPELVESLILTGYAPFIPQYLEETMEKQYHSFLAIKETAPETASHFQSLHGDRWYKTLKLVLDTFTYHYPTMTKVDFEKLIVPTLLLNGEKEKHECEAAILLKEYSKNIHIGLVPFAGHVANLEQPEMYNHLVTTFINKISTLQQA
ncbi:alpha/beta hydrolase [Fictibacillus nanhaiensis]|uniref:alpha/beta fold hydrolase n=1 Tax=Fictibacillus nanhaiensis TaxID=742169 RepID=UPI001C940D68|nr:alpha/beta hydrolase [Fictibacillus nanhaiensis]MBY6037666.1 alpha/beta hydrolase [Fictibacillus nanhaiensis]